MEARFRKGKKRIADTCWIVETIDRKTDDFRKVGKIRVSGKLVREEMHSHKSIKGYEPYDIAQKMAEKKFPRADPVIVSKISCRRRKH